MSNLYEELKEYSKTDMYPFHMPGHKRRWSSISDSFSIDITEIDSFDNLHHAEGILKEVQGKAARIYGAEETYLLVNGSTGGILSAISACVRRGGTFLMGRNCHKAAYHGAYLREASVRYLYPQVEKQYDINCGQDPERIREMLISTPDIEAVLITSPTYDGVISDVRGIAEVVHSFDIPLIVDEAHGAHLGFHPWFPESAIACGGDIVIQSIHKTLPSLTQTALLHVNGELVNREKLREFLGIYQTSSPSYVLMASMEQCIHKIEEEGATLFQKFAKRLECFYDNTKELKYIHVIRPEEVQGEHIYRFDPSKLILSVKYCNITGHELGEILRKRYHLEMEMEAAAYVLALTSIMDTKEGFERLAEGLKQIDIGLAADVGVERTAYPKNEVVMKISEAEEMPKETVLLKESCQKISGEYIYLYPPGIPLVIPGERISETLLNCIEDYRMQGLSLQGLRDYQCRTIQVCIK